MEYRYFSDSAGVSTADTRHALHGRIELEPGRNHGLLETDVAGTKNEFGHCPTSCTYFGCLVTFEALLILALRCFIRV